MDNEKPVYRVYIESIGNTRILLLETDNYKEAMETYKAYGGKNGFLDENNYWWDLYIDEN